MSEPKKDQQDQTTRGVGPPAAADLAEFAFGGTEHCRRFWEAVPVLAWTRDELGRLQLAEAACAYDGPTDDEAPRSLPPEIDPRVGSQGRYRSFLVLQVPADARTREVGVALDITRQQSRLDELLHLAVEDELTGLYNRRGFQLFAEHELRSARRRKTHSAVIYVDCDGLKDVNDRFGHERGDALLMQTAKLLHEVFRECDVIGRIGGDEFAVFAPDVRGDPEQLRARLMTRLADWGDAPGTPAEMRISAGLAYSGADQSFTLGELLAEADIAMYAAKAAKAR